MTQQDLDDLAFETKDEALSIIMRLQSERDKLLSEIDNLKYDFKWAMEST